MLVLAAWFGWSIDSEDGAGTLLVTVLSPLAALTLVVVALALGQTSTRRWLAAVGVADGAGHGRRGGWRRRARLSLACFPGWPSPFCCSRSSPAGSRAGSLARIRSNGRFAPRYVAVVGALLISLAVLPTVAFFQDAFAVSMESLGRARQIKLAEQVDLRAKDLSESFKDLSGKDQLLKFWEASEWDDSGVTAFARAAQNGRTSPLTAINRRRWSHP